MYPKIWSMMFFVTLIVREPFHRKDFKWEKKNGVKGLISEKTEVLYAERNKKAEAAFGSYFTTGDSLQYIYSGAMTKNHRNIRSRYLVHEFSFIVIFQRYWSWFQGSYIKEIFFVAAFILYGCGYLFLLWKGAQSDAYCNCIKPP